MTTDQQFYPVAYQYGPVFDTGRVVYVNPEEPIKYGFMIQPGAHSIDVIIIDAESGNVYESRRIMPIGQFTRGWQ